MFTTYTAIDGCEFPVNETDLVIVQTKQGPKPTGYNHYRAWHACLVHSVSTST